MTRGTRPFRRRPRAGLLALAIAFAPLATLGLPGAAGQEDLAALQKRLELAVKNQDVARAENAIDGLCALGGAKALDLVIRAMLVIESKSFFDHAVEKLVGLGTAGLAEHFDELLANRKAIPEEIGVALVVAAKLEDEPSERWIAAGLRHEEELVVRWAIDGARERKTKGAIPVLFELLEARGIDGDAISYDARRALIALTRRDFTNAEDWRKFWEAEGASLDPKALEEGEGNTGIALVDPDAPEFFGVKIVSDRVAFIIDTSGSMLQFDPGSNGESWESRQRITRLKRQLSAAIQKLPDDAWFNVIAFNEEIELFQKRIVPAKSGAKQQALAFIQKLVADRGTDTGLAIETAFRDPKVDTIVLLSDGSPETPAGKPAELIPIVEQKLRDLNRLRKVRVHTLGFAGKGEWPPGSKYGKRPMPDSAELEAFLQRLAEAHGGTYTRID